MPPPYIQDIYHPTHGNTDWRKDKVHGELDKFMIITLKNIECTNAGQKETFG